MSKPDHHFSSMGAAPADWLAQMTDPKAWQSMVNLAQAGMPSMSAMPAMPSMPAHPAMAALVPPEKLAALQKEFTESMSTLWADLLASRTPQIRDRRFSAPAWQSNPLYAFNAASYLLNARMMNALADAVEADVIAQVVSAYALGGRKDGRVSRNLPKGGSEDVVKANQSIRERT